MDYKEINDYEQLYLIKENDDIAKEVMYTKYKPIVVSLASKYYNLLSKSGIDMDDLVQEGYIGLFNAINSFLETANACFYTFSIICVERQIKSYCKKYLSNKNKVMNNSYSIDAIGSDNDFLSIDVIEDSYSNNNPDIYLTNAYDYIRMINFKHTLPLKESLIFELRYNGFKYREIANLLDISCNCVDNSIHRIKGKLTFYLDK